jgi:pilus assembly protein CpaF
MCGLPGTGKTELLKYLTGDIPENDRVITIEDNLEIHYAEINPGKDCVELKVDADRFDYVKAIKACLRQNPQWILLSEARSTEVKYLIESMSTGTHCLTTIHTDDVRKVPDRIKNMVQDSVSAERIENDVYAFLDVAVLIRKTIRNGKIFRYIDQLCFFSREEKEGNVVSMVVDGGKIVSDNVPPEIMRKFELAGTKNPFSNNQNDEIEE